MAGSTFEPIHLPEWAWRSDEARQILRDRNTAAILHMAQQYAGASQHRIATAIGILQGRVSEILKGNRQVSALEVFERIADGLNMPDHARVTLGLAPRHGGRAAAGLLPSLEIARVFTDQAAAAEEIRDLVRKAATVDVLAVRGLGLLGLNHSLLLGAITDDSRDTPCGCACCCWTRTAPRRGSGPARSASRPSRCPAGSGSPSPGSASSPLLVRSPSRSLAATGCPSGGSSTSTRPCTWARLPRRGKGTNRPSTSSPPARRGCCTAGCGACWRICASTPRGSSDLGGAMIEAELKARVTDPEQVYQRLAARAAERRSVYHDTYFDRPDRSLTTAG